MIGPDLFTPVADCPATREAVTAFCPTACVVCGRPADAHHPENADVVRDDQGDLAAWMLSLPRHP